MENDLQKQINDIYKSLPIQIQKAITESGWEQKIRAIGKRHDLVIGEAAALETETFLVMLGLKSVNDYRKNLEQEIKIPKEKMDVLIKNVEEQIFQNIKKALMNIAPKQEEEEKIDIPVPKEQKPTTPEANQPEKSPEPKITKQSINDEIGDEIEILDEEIKPDPIKESFITEKLKNESVSLKESHEIKDVDSSPKTESDAPKFDPYREPIDLDDVEI